MNFSNNAIHHANWRDKFIIMCTAALSFPKSNLMVAVVLFPPCTIDIVYMVMVKADSYI